MERTEELSSRIWLESCVRGRESATAGRWRVAKASQRFFQITRKSPGFLLKID
jgi:hypothetical protein